MNTKNLAAQLLGSLGGKARAKKLKKAQRLAISQKANDAKAAKKLAKLGISTDGK